MKSLKYAVLFMLGLSLALLSCTKPETFDVAAVRKAIEAGNAKWVEAFNRGDAAGVAALYTDNAALLPPNSEMIQGRQGIQNFWNGGFQMGLKDAALTTVDVGGNGDTAFEIGKYTLKIQPAGQEGMSDSGKYVVVWKRQVDGTWKLHADIWNSSMPMPGQ
ncbi:SgcJ/EcaC family oxidoreductase [candidate division KSB1 bacterium]|nr:SgcJ/EcaC family oxidoreductase [candidate division KSB1 bacterium]